MSNTIQKSKSTGVMANLLMKLAVVTSALLPVSFASAAVAESACCKSGVACAQMINDLQAACASGQSSLKPTCVAMKGLVSFEWLLNYRDLSPLKKSDKDFAGTYQLKVGEQFVITNKWKKTDAPGISADSQNDIRLKQVCYNPSSIQVSGKVNAFVSFGLEFQTQVVKVNGISGYFGSAGEDRDYFFYPVTADRKIITSF